MFVYGQWTDKKKKNGVGYRVAAQLKITTKIILILQDPIFFPSSLAVNVSASDLLSIVRSITVGEGALGCLPAPPRSQHSGCAALLACNYNSFLQSLGNDG